MAVQYDPIAKDESLNTTEGTSRNIADVLAQELSGIANAITGGSDKVPKTDIATVEPNNTASRAYSVGELVYVNGNLYKVITAITSGATFTVGTNIQSTNVSSICEELRVGYKVGTVSGTTDTTGNIALQIDYRNTYVVSITGNLVYGNALKSPNTYKWLAHVTDYTGNTYASRQIDLTYVYFEFT